MEHDDQPLDDAQEQMWRTYITMAEYLGSHLQQHLQRECDLSAADYNILIRLAESAGRRMSITEIATATGWEKSRLSHQLTRMARRDLVERVASDHNRYPDVVLTDQGHAAITKAAPAHAEMVRTLFVDVLGPERLADFASACTDVLHALETHQNTTCSL